MLQEIGAQQEVCLFEPWEPAAAGLHTAV